MDIEYFDLHGRALQLRMLAWYCNVPHTNTRVNMAEFGEKKQKGMYRFGSMPVAKFQDGSQMGQTQAIMRWIAQSCTGKRGEILYPGVMNPEVSYEIDNLTEFSDSYLGKFSEYLRNVSNERAKELAEGPFRDVMFRIDAQLKQNSSPNFLVGNCLTLADISLGAYTLKWCVSDTHPH